MTPTRAAYVPPTLVPLFSTSDDQQDGLLEASKVTLNFATSLTYTDK